MSKNRSLDSSHTLPLEPEGHSEERVLAEILHHLVQSIHTADSTGFHAAEVSLLNLNLYDLPSTPANIEAGITALLKAFKDLYALYTGRNGTSDLPGIQRIGGLLLILMGRAAKDSIGPTPLVKKAMASLVQTQVAADYEESPELRKNANFVYTAWTNWVINSPETTPEDLTACAAMPLLPYNALMDILDHPAADEQVRIAIAKSPCLLRGFSWALDRPEVFRSERVMAAVLETNRLKPNSYPVDWEMVFDVVPSNLWPLCTREMLKSNFLPENSPGDRDLESYAVMLLGRLADEPDLKYLSPTDLKEGLACQNKNVRLACMNLLTKLSRVQGTKTILPSVQR